MLLLLKPDVLEENSILLKISEKGPSTIWKDLKNRKGSLLFTLLHFASLRSKRLASVP